MEDKSNEIIDNIKYCLFDENDKAQAAADGTEHSLGWHSWADEHSFIVIQDGVEYRVSVTKELD